MTVLMSFGFAVSYVGVILTLWGAVELAILAERDRVKRIQDFRHLSATLAPVALTTFTYFPRILTASLLSSGAPEPVAEAP